MNNDVIGTRFLFTQLDKSFKLVVLVGLICFSLTACTKQVGTTPQDPLVPAAVTVESRITVSSDDAEEHANGAVNRTSSRLELGNASSSQRVGLRFVVAIPKGAVISKAYLQFKTATVSSGATTLTLRGQTSDNAPTFESRNGNISSRTTTSATVTWSPPAWTLAGEAGLRQQSPDLSSIIQEIVNRPGWVSGNALALIITGTGERVATSFDGDRSGAPLLHVDYLPLMVTLSPPSATLSTGQSLSFTATVTGNSNTSVTWSATGGTVTGSGNTITYKAPATAGTYTLIATSVVDPSKTATASITVSSSPTVTVSLNPSSATLGPNATATFTATVSGTSTTGVTWSATGGTITGTGNTVTYKAPGTTGTYTLTATSVADTTKKATATITVSNTSVTFAAAGDFGGDPTRAGTVMNDLKTRSARAFLLLGDMSYDEIIPESAWCDWVHSYLGASYPVELVSGNHEEDSRVDGHIRNFTACMPDRLGSALGPGGYGVNFAFDLGPVTVIAIAPNLTIDGVAYNYGSGSAELSWLINQARTAKTEGDWVVVGMHKNCITIGNKSCEIGQAFAQLLITEKVDLVLQGHDHDYQRSHALAKIQSNTVPTGAIADNGSDNLYARGVGTVFVIAGTVGRSLTICTHTDTEYAYFASHYCAEEGNIKGYLLLNASSTQLDVRFITTVGSFSDTFTIR